jgi:1,4-dihydroxy-2-naphthoate octaprenyltransferase
MAEYVIALRPWSLPASIVPTVLAAALSLRAAPSPAQLLDAALAVACGVLVHLGANATNTYFDFASGLDTRAAADDRALVDGRVDARALGALAAALYAGGLAVALRLAAGLELFAPATAAAAAAAGDGTARGFALVIGAGLLLSVLYSAGAPRALKYVGLGDATIFACFGPLLMGATAAAITRAPPSASVMLASVPIGLLTVNILHANNTRDTRADAAGGAVTVARLLGFQRSLLYYAANFALAYVLSAAALAAELAARAGVASPAALAAALAQRAAADPLGLARLLLTGGPGPAEAAASAAAGSDGAAVLAAVAAARAAGFLAAATLPWALALVSRFARRELAALPQATAQFHLLFGFCVIEGLASRASFARFLLAAGAAAALASLDTGARLRALLPAAAAAPLGALVAVAGPLQLAAAAAFAFAHPFRAELAREAAAALAASLLAGAALNADLHSVGYDAATAVRDVDGAEGAAAKPAAPAPATARKRRQSGAAAAPPAAAAAAAAAASASAPAAQADADALFGAAAARLLCHVGLAGALISYTL